MKKGWVGSLAKPNGKVLVLGAGESGAGAACLAKKKGFRVFVSDNGTIAEKYKDVLGHNGIEWEEGGHSDNVLDQVSVVVKSPGIPSHVPIIKKCGEQDIPVISEIEFASNFSEAMILGITGSNGKTTTTSLTHHLLVNDGLDAGLAGNIGKSFALQVAETERQHYVLEISSFQLDDIEDFHPHVAIITNITPDHLDRYDYDFEKYIEAKFKITKNQDENDYLIYDADDEVINNWLEKNNPRARLLPFSLEKSFDEGAWLEDDTIITKLNNNFMRISTDYLALEGRHNVKNTMAASLAAQLVKVRKEAIRKSIQTFQGVPHRLEKVLRINHVEYINDSKATNVNATYFALDGIKRPIVWLVGGQDKGNDYSSLMPLVREKVKGMICLGVDNEKLINTFGNVIEPLVETFSMDEAVKVAYKIAQRGDVVLLSPACASFDLFKNYEDRGDQFKEAIRKL